MISMHAFNRPLAVALFGETHMLVAGQFVTG
jgi:hypothetical protein